MAPSPERPEENQDPEPSEPKDNPFIRFRQFADAQIGSLLQGVIGLPSAFSKNEKGNTRWADFDDDLRRRDEIHAKQRQLREADRQTRDEQLEKQAYHPAVGQNAETLAASDRTLSHYFPSNEKTGKDIPLYTPVTKALFAYLDGGGSPNWNPLSYKRNYTDDFRLEYLPFEVRAEQHPSNGLQALQYMAYNELNRFTFLRSDYSLLPYLLFSPYSPIRLEEEAAKDNTRSTSGRSAGSRDNIPYKVAFEDLIQTTQGPPQRPFKFYGPFFPFTEFRGRLNQVNASSASMGWIYDLYGKNLLQERELRELTRSDDIWHPSPFAEMTFEVLHSQSLDTKGRGLKKMVEDASGAPETEQEMYDRFIEWASSPSAILRSVDHVNKDPTGWLNEQVALLESEKGRRVMQKVIETQFPKEVNALFDMFDTLEKQDSGVRRNQAKEFNEPLEGLFEQTNQSCSLSLPSKTQEKNLSVQESFESSDKVVSTSTTTEHTTHEDGSVETNVTVWKRYADGRESTTTTNHFANPPCDENGNPILPQNLEQRTEVGDEKKPEKKGWFWN